MLVENGHAPVVIFVFRRPDHLRGTIESLMRCDGFERSPIIVYGDGPRNAGEDDAVRATRQVARELLRDRAEYHFSDRNLGLARSVIVGVSEAVERFGRVIVVEDDLELHPYFLTFMNRALERYESETDVYQVSGYMVDVPELADTRSALFLPFTVSWGWATWKRAWDRFDPLAAGWETLRTDKDLRRRFNLDGAYDYATMLERQMAGQLDSWAIRWYWSVFKAQGLVLFPPVSLVRNRGFDGSGTHGRGWLRRFRFANSTEALPSFDVVLPNETAVSEHYAVVKHALWKQNGGKVGQLIDVLKRLFFTLSLTHHAF